MEDFRTELDSKKRLIEKMVDSMEHTVAEHYQELAIENSRVKKVIYFVHLISWYVYI